MSVDQILLIGQAAFLCALYLFLAVLAVILARELRRRSVTTDERAPGDLLVIEPFESGLEAGERIPLLARTRVGRGDENDLVLPDAFVSSDHARLSWNGKGWVLEDLGSRNGTFLKGEPVQRPTVVKTGDTIEFGRVKVKLVSV